MQSYDSDHDAITIRVSINICDSSPNTFTEPVKKLFKKTNWKKFTRVAHNNYTSTLPANVNLSNDQIDSAIQNINEALLKTISQVVPDQNPSVTSTKYINRKIQKLHKQKSYYLSQLLKLKRTGINSMNQSHNSPKHIISDINNAINSEIVSEKSKY